MYAPFHEHRFSLRLFRRGLPDESVGLPRNDFLALAQSVRRVYLTKEPCHFKAVAELVDQNGNAQLRQEVTLVCSDWQRALSGSWAVRTRTHSFNARTAFDTWLNADGFHGEPSLQASYEALLSTGLIAENLVQSTVWFLARAALALDSLVVELVGGLSLPVPPETIPAALRL